MTEFHRDETAHHPEEDRWLCKGCRWWQAEHDGPAVDENVLAGPCRGGVVVGGLAGGAPGAGPAGVPGPFEARPGVGRTARPTIGWLRFDTPAPAVAAAG